MVEYTRIVASTSDSFRGWIAGTGPDEKEKDKGEK